MADGETAQKQKFVFLWRELTHKVAQIILQARVQLPVGLSPLAFSSTSSMSPSQIRKNKYFDLETDDIEFIANELARWRQFNERLLSIEIFAIRRSSSSSSSSMSLQQQQQQPVRKILLERWSLQLRSVIHSSATFSNSGSGSGSGSNANNTAGIGPSTEIPRIYKNLLCLIRALYSMLRLLPCHELFRRLQRNRTLGFSLGFHLVAVDESSVGMGPESYTTRGFGSATDTCLFADTATPYGLIHCSCEYLRCLPGEFLNARPNMRTIVINDYTTTVAAAASAATATATATAGGSSSSSRQSSFSPEQPAELLTELSTSAAARPRSMTMPARPSEAASIAQSLPAAPGTAASAMASMMPPSVAAQIYQVVGGYAAGLPPDPQDTRGLLPPSNPPQRTPSFAQPVVLSGASSAAASAAGTPTGSVGHSASSSPRNMQHAAQLQQPLGKGAIATSVSPPLSSFLGSQQMLAHGTPLHPHPLLMAATGTSAGTRNSFKLSFSPFRESPPNFSMSGTGTSTTSRVSALTTTTATPTMTSPAVPSTVAAATAAAAVTAPISTLVASGKPTTATDPQQLQTLSAVATAGTLGSAAALASANAVAVSSNEYPRQHQHQHRVSALDDDCIFVMDADVPPVGAATAQTATVASAGHGAVVSLAAGRNMLSPSPPMSLLDRLHALAPGAAATNRTRPLPSATSDDDVLEMFMQLCSLEPERVLSYPKDGWPAATVLVPSDVLGHIARAWPLP